MTEREINAPLRGSDVWIGLGFLVGLIGMTLIMVYGWDEYGVGALVLGLVFWAVCLMIGVPLVARHSA